MAERYEILRKILTAWASYAFLWLGMIASVRWAPEDAGLFVIFSFGVGLIIIAVATVWVTGLGLLQFVRPAGRPVWFRGLVILSAVGVIGQWLYVFAYW